MRHAGGVLEIDDGIVPYRGISLIRNYLLLGPYRRTMPRVLGWT